MTEAAMTDVQDLTLDEVRVALAEGIASNAAFDGWGDEARDMAADVAGIDRDIARLAFKDGAVAMIDAWFARIDQAMVEAIPAEQAAAMKIRQRITALVEARLAAVAPNREALRRALTILAMPQNAASGARLGWRTVDAIWAQAGDTATDYNHYTKRATLFAVYGSTIAVFLNDDSEDHADTRAFLARRIEGIMRFEKWKAGVAKRGENMPSLSRFIGRLRYPAV
ncbi:MULTISPECIES: COQ9 family protein [unclassified Sphingomonas]|uniref:COQ9 family protein n=1 Tax=unclassified Sphingomonas TaxID=196159 RepID=UPI0028590D7A|nr:MULTISPECIES: COQ9 family protein [unclassified Sphingomonas]MDR6114330.1 ubiquinone biosynthesis protein COQ9 [Sphingomonas sp. SORGH_AS_0789]MDR6148310.1 ubiquinone biosynthesis protein COQ9 [Sphingomonas sp. SORGH_AS_0742]